MEQEKSHPSGLKYNTVTPEEPDLSATPSSKNESQSEKTEQEANGSLITRFHQIWSENIAFDVHLIPNRDHLANERTFHAWLRLSIGMSSMGIVIAQMSRIQHAVRPQREHDVKYYVLGVPQACICQVIAVTIILVGTYRFFKQQGAITQGQARIGGWELYVLVATIGVMLLAFFCLIFFVDIIQVFG